MQKQTNNVKYSLQESAITASCDRLKICLTWTIKSCLVQKDVIQQVLLTENDPQNIFQPLVDRRGLAEVRSTEPSLSSFLIRSFNILFFVDGDFLTSFVNQLNLFSLKIFLNSCFCCYFMSEEIYDV